VPTSRASCRKRRSLLRASRPRTYAAHVHSAHRATHINQRHDWCDSARTAPTRRGSPPPVSLLTMRWNIHAAARMAVKAFRCTRQRHQLCSFSRDHSRRRWRATTRPLAPLSAHSTAPDRTGPHRAVPGSKAPTSPAGGGRPGAQCARAAVVGHSKRPPAGTCVRRVVPRGEGRGLRLIAPVRGLQVQHGGTEALVPQGGHEAAGGRLQHNCRLGGPQEHKPPPGQSAAHEALPTHRHGSSNANGTGHGGAHTGDAHHSQHTICHGSASAG
jgi:hypothetical protein